MSTSGYIHLLMGDFMGNVIALANQKGGTGKTTTTINLAGALAEVGKKILAVDLDPQGSLGIGFGVDVSRLENNLYDVIVKGGRIREVIRAVREKIDLAPTNIQLSQAEPQLVGAYRREDRLKNAIMSIRDQYDFILIDCPPSLGMLTINALAATDYVLIPMSCDYYSLVGVTLLLQTIIDIQAQVNPHLEVLGIAATRYDGRTKHSQEVLEEVRNKLGRRYRVFEAVIRETVRLKETPITGQPITEYSSAHPAADDYRALAQEVLKVYE
jgi:chromosome partitioning protein